MTPTRAGGFLQTTFRGGFFCLDAARIRDPKCLADHAWRGVLSPAARVHGKEAAGFPAEGIV